MIGEISEFPVHDYNVSFEIHMNRRGAQSFTKILRQALEERKMP